MELRQVFTHMHDCLMAEVSQTGGPLQCGVESDGRRSGGMGWGPAILMLSISALNSKEPEKSIFDPELLGCHKGVGGQNRVYLTATLF